jgi:hypothetical protein
MATHGRSGVGRLVLGSVATTTLHLAAVPLLLVRQTTAAAPAAEAPPMPAMATQPAEA